MRSGTSIGANIEEALGGLSEADFSAKLGIAYKEARETSCWIRLLKETGYLVNAESSSLLKDVIELQKIIGSIRLTLKKKTHHNSKFIIGIKCHISLRNTV